jgi:hypothetical protein
MFIKYVNGAELHEYKAVKQHCFYEDNDEPTLSYVPENLNTVNNRKPSTRIIIIFLTIYKNAYISNFCMGPSQSTQIRNKLFVKRLYNYSTAHELSNKLLIACLVHISVLDKSTGYSRLHV